MAFFHIFTFNKGKIRFPCNISRNILFEISIGLHYMSIRSSIHIHHEFRNIGSRLHNLHSFFYLISSISSAPLVVSSIYLFDREFIFVLSENLKIIFLKFFNFQFFIKYRILKSGSAPANVFQETF